MKSIAAVPSGKATLLIQAFLSGRNALTARAYRQDLHDFACFIGVDDADNAARHLLSMPVGDANALVLAHRSQMVERGLQASTINRRLAALRALVKLARVLGLVTWALEIPNLKVDQSRDLRGPSRAALQRALAALEQRHGPKARRDLAILRLLHDLGLRRGEVVSLDLEHVNIEASTLAVLGKGRGGRETLSLPGPTLAALYGWLGVRGTTPGPLFNNFDRARKGSRLTGAGLYRLTKGLGVGRPHGIRHAAITEALDLMAGDLRKVQKFSRHRDVRLLNVYDDSRMDFGGEVSRAVAANL